MANADVQPITINPHTKETPHSAAVTCLACSKDGSIWVSGGYDNVLKVYDADLTKVLHNLRHRDKVAGGWALTQVCLQVLCCTFSRTSGNVVSGGRDKVIRVWDPVAGTVE